MMRPTWSRPTRVACVVAICALLALVIFAGIPRSTQLMHVLHKTGHPIAFGIVAVLLLILLRDSNSTKTTRLGYSYVWALGGAIVLGAFTEVAQLFTNRGSSTTDVLRDTVGAIAALGIFSYVFKSWRISRHARQLQLLIGIVAAFIAFAPLMWCVAAYINREASFPSIVKLDSPLDTYFVAPMSDEKASAAALIGDMDKSVWDVTFLPGMSAGLQIMEPHADWRGYGSLAIDINNPGERAVQIMVRVHDREHDWNYEDRFNRVVMLQPLTRQSITVPIAEIIKAPQRREMDLSRIANVAIFVWQSRDSGSFQVYSVKLQ